MKKHLYVENREKFVKMSHGLDEWRSRPFNWKQYGPEDTGFVEVIVKCALEDLTKGAFNGRVAQQINMKDVTSGDSLLLKACRLNLHELVRDLLKFPQLDVNCKNMNSGYGTISACILSNCFCASS